jgi:predicted NUDIX family NTP pyrophosphohydrolase
MQQVSAGLLLYRHRDGKLEVLLVHPGGPYWASRDAGAWSVPKGLVEDDEDQFAAARREFTEETGVAAPATGGHDLGTFRQPSGKRVRVWAIEGDCNPAELVSNLFEIEWPPGSGRAQQFPEVDRSGWFSRSAALVKIARGQQPILEKFFADFAPSEPVPPA